MNWYFHVLGKYAIFSGRAQRKEFWFFWLFNVIIAIALAVFELWKDLFPQTDESVLASCYGLFVLLPTLAVGARRLHDTGRTGWWQLINVIPLVGTIGLIVVFAKDSQTGSNQYGPNPKGIDNKPDEPRQESTNATPKGGMKQPVVVILVVAAVIVALYYIMSPYQICIRNQPDQKSDRSKTFFCQNRTSW